MQYYVSSSRDGGTSSPVRYSRMPYNQRAFLTNPDKVSIPTSGSLSQPCLIRISVTKFSTVLYLQLLSTPLVPISTSRIVWMRLAWDSPVLRTLTQSMYSLARCLIHCHGNIASQPIEMVRTDSGDPYRCARKAENRCDVHFATGPSFLWVLIVVLIAKNSGKHISLKSKGVVAAPSHDALQ